MSRIAICGLLAVIMALGACGTIDGIGQDISSASRNVQSWF